MRKTALAKTPLTHAACSPPEPEADRLSWKRRAWSATAIVGVIALTQAAHAQSIEAIELRVTPDGRGCITEAALRARIASLNVRGENTDGLAFAVDASSEPAVLEVRKDDVLTATRRFDALPERCAERLQTIALVIALAIEHAATNEDDGADTPVEAETQTPGEVLEPATTREKKTSDAEPAPAAAVESDDGSVERHEPALRVIVGVGGAFGLLPELSGTLALGVELPSEALRVGVGALVTTETSTSLAGGTALTQLAGVRAYGCSGGGAWALDLQACAGVALGGVSGTGRDYEKSAKATGTLLSPLLRFGARYPAQGLFSFGFALEAFVNVVRPELQVSGNAGAVSTVSLFGALLSIEGVLTVP